jgi:hypothetical protein
VKHERHDATVAKGTEVLGRHLEEREVVGQELAPHSEEDRERTRKQQRVGRDLDERPAVGHHDLDQASIVVGHGPCASGDTRAAAHSCIIKTTSTATITSTTTSAIFHGLFGYSPAIFPV